MEPLVERERELDAVARVVRERGVLVIEGGAGLGKTSLLQAACRQASARGDRVVCAGGSELESGFAFGVVRQLFERAVAEAGPDALAGPAQAAAALLGGGDEPPGTAASDTFFAVVHGLYWVTANLSARRPLLVAVDDAHWADAASLHFLAYLARRLDGLAVTLVVVLRPLATAATESALTTVREAASAVVVPRLLSVTGTGAVVRAALGHDADEATCRAVHEASGGNPFYARQLARGAAGDGPGASALPVVDEIARRVVARVYGLDPRALALARAVAVLGDGGELRQAAAIAGLGMEDAAALAGGLERLEVLAPGAPLRVVHPVVRAALEASMDSGERDAAHRAAARLLHAEGAAPGQVAAHLTGLHHAGDPWVVDRLREGARAALDGGAPASAGALLRRALAEPPPATDRVAVLREAARAEAGAGLETAVALLEEASALVDAPGERAEIALEVAEAYAALFRWVDAVEVLERALGELADGNGALAARLEGELVVSGLHDARGAGRARAALARLASRAPSGAAREALAVAQGMVRFVTGHPADETAPPLEAALAAAGPGVENWDTRAALLWVLVACERFDAVDAALVPLEAEVKRSGSARGLVAVYSTLGLLRLRLGALPEADAAARVALAVLQEGDFAPGLGFAATVLADVAVEAGRLDEAEAVLALLPPAGWPPGVGTVLIPATRGRLRLAQGRPAEALADFEACIEMFGSPAWGMETHETGYVHARSGAALALLRLGEGERAGALAEAELADVRVLGTPRAIGVALRASGLARGGPEGAALLRESVTVLRESPAALERAHALAALGGMLRRAGHRRDAREPLAEALEIAARCGARPLAARAREELVATGARPRRAWRTGVEALTPQELRVARLAAAGRTNREIAVELYVTLKTVEGHLARAYAKLGIDGRRDLVRALGE